MKHVVFGLCATLIIIAILMNAVAIEGSGIRERDLKSALHAALEQALYDAATRESYTTEDSRLLLADAAALLLPRLNSNDKNLSVSLYVAGADAEKGLLCVRATETFTRPNGRLKTIEDEATVILEREIPKQIYTISYLLPQKLQNELLLPKTVRRYCIEEGSLYMVPDTPKALKSRGYDIQSWLDKKTGASYTKSQLEKLAVSKDMELWAVVD